MDVGYGKHILGNHGKDEFVRGRVHVNEIEAFWGTKARLLRFRRIHKSTLYLHLKECEFRFNYQGQNLYPLILKVLRKHPLN